MTFTVSPGGQGFYYFSDLFKDTKAQLEFSLCPLVAMGTKFALLIIYRYNSTTGIFTVPSGGYGYYYFSIYLVVNYYEYGLFDIQVNGETLCSAFTDQQGTTTADSGQAACSGAAYVTEGINSLCANTLPFQIKVIT